MSNCTNNTCSVCGIEAKPNEVFHQEPRSFSIKTDSYCLACWNKRQRRQLKFLVALVVLVLVLSILGALTTQGVAARYSGFLITLAMTCLMIVPHELGHALAALVCGCRVFMICIGCGRSIWRFELAGCDVEIRAFPFSGYVLASPRILRFPRLTLFLNCLGGPAANAALLAVAVSFCSLEELLTLDSTSFAATLAQANLLVLIGALLPHRWTMYVGALRLPVLSDGLALLCVPFLSQTECEQSHAAYFTLESQYCWRRGDYEKAKQWCTTCLERYPHDVGCRAQLGFVLTFLKDHEGARREWLRLLEQPDLSSLLRPVLLNNVAWADLMIGGELLQEADRLSQEALASMPDYPPFKGTRGSVLIEQGDAEAGLPLVEAALAGNVEARMKALNLCYIALGQIKSSRFGQAVRSRNRAVELDPDCCLLGKVDRLLGATC